MFTAMKTKMKRKRRELIFFFSYSVFLVLTIMFHKVHLSKLSYRSTSEKCLAKFLLLHLCCILGSWVSMYTRTYAVLPWNSAIYTLKSAFITPCLFTQRGEGERWIWYNWNFRSKSLQPTHITHYLDLYTSVWGGICIYTHFQRHTHILLGQCIKVDNFSTGVIEIYLFIQRLAFCC